MRFEFISSLFVASGFQGLEADMRSRMFMNFMVAEPGTCYHAATKNRRQMLDLCYSSPDGAFDRNRCYRIVSSDK
jgi:hypothetical protein